MNLREISWVTSEKSYRGLVVLTLIALLLYVDNWRDRNFNTVGGCLERHVSSMHRGEFIADRKFYTLDSSCTLLFIDHVHYENSDPGV